ncbi:hypothetical protein GRJ2_000727800 [Grus japonensis]|uniref:Uncharacterized protein n=1 Tax=Grus japonensis TaxID=30415 RepID=A0ABC9WBX4_GRUJA
MADKEPENMMKICESRNYQGTFMEKSSYEDLQGKLACDFCVFSQFIHSHWPFLLSGLSMTSSWCFEHETSEQCVFSSLMSY